MHRLLLPLLFSLACTETQKDSGSGPLLGECVTTYEVMCEGGPFPSAGDGCFESCSPDSECGEGTCTQALLGCASDDDACQACSFTGWVCLE
jgi:hypothetical protein